MDWTIWIQFTLTGLTAMVAFSGLIAAIGYLFGTLKKGKNHGELDTITLLKEQINALEKKVEDQQLQIEELQKSGIERQQRIEELYKENLEKNKKLAESLAIIQGRNPQMDEVILMMKSYITTNVPLLENIRNKTLPTIERLEKYLDKQSF